jgi:hypothetical protein
LTVEFILSECGEASEEVSTLSDPIATQVYRDAFYMSEMRDHAELGDGQRLPVAQLDIVLLLAYFGTRKRQTFGCAG